MKKEQQRRMFQWINDRETFIMTAFLWKMLLTPNVMQEKRHSEIGSPTFKRRFSSQYLREYWNFKRWRLDVIECGEREKWSIRTPRFGFSQAPGRERRIELALKSSKGHEADQVKVVNQWRRTRYFRILCLVYHNLCSYKQHIGF